MLFFGFRCPNCGRRGHLVHQCRAFSSSQHPKSILTVVSYEDRNRKRRRPVADVGGNDDDGGGGGAFYRQQRRYEPEVEATPARESDSAKRKRIKLELKEKRRAFRSYPHTPTGPFLPRRNPSEPVSPFGDLDLSVFSVTRYFTSSPPCCSSRVLVE